MTEYACLDGPKTCASIPGRLSTSRAGFRTNAGFVCPGRMPMYVLPGTMCWLSSTAFVLALINVREMHREVRQIRRGAIHTLPIQRHFSEQAMAWEACSDGGLH